MHRELAGVTYLVGLPGFPQRHDPFPPTSQRWSRVKKKVLFQWHGTLGILASFNDQKCGTWDLDCHPGLYPLSAQQPLQFSSCSPANETKAEVWPPWVCGFPPTTGDARHSTWATVQSGQWTWGEQTSPSSSSTAAVLQTNRSSLCYAAMGHEAASLHSHACIGGRSKPLAWLSILTTVYCKLSLAKLIIFTCFLQCQKQWNTTRSSPPFSHLLLSIQAQNEIFAPLQTGGPVHVPPRTHWAPPARQAILL